MSLWKTLRTRFKILRHFFRFLLEYKMLWMMPMIVLLIAFSVLILIGQSTPLGPFIYTIF